MTKRKATLEEARNFIKRKVKEDTLHYKHVEIILDNVFPYSWQIYCDNKKIKSILNIKEKNK